MDKTDDVIVIGGGAAGLSAALMLGRARRRVSVIDAGSPRNRFAAHMHGVLGDDGTPPGELLARGRAEVAAYGVATVTGEVARVDESEEGMLVRLRDGRDLAARAVIVATGLTDRLPEIPGLADRWGRSVLHCPYCHGWEVRDAVIGVLATSPLSIHQAFLLRQWTDRVVVFTAGLGELDAEARRRLTARGSRLVDSPVVEVLGEGEAISAVRTASGELVSVDAIFTAGTAEPHDGFLAHLDLARTDGPMGRTLTVDERGRTSHPRIWAAGNVVNPAANVPVAMGAGSFAGAAVNAALVQEDVDRAVAHDAASGATLADFWERRYADSARVWSGRVNRVLADVAATLRPGTAMDLGCGEGADVIWLAEQGWRATGIDISATAVARATAAAGERGMSARTRFVAADLGEWDEEAAFDLVTASFLHSPVMLPRVDILRAAAARVAPGGHLLITSHVSPPSWSTFEPGHAPLFRTAEEEVAALDLDDAAWDRVVVEHRHRDTTAPDGSPASIDDGVILLRRR
ncbi:FAD-dependent oxidoreductase [Microbacterium sp. NPDC089189]|uniref:FAD-dependent oxidoreductase n=1 Tax=Microbacterium sp. NPDC089189 TaxID=3154972 RepID=UPI003421D289